MQAAAEMAAPVPAVAMRAMRCTLSLRPDLRGHTRGRKALKFAKGTSDSSTIDTRALKNGNVVTEGVYLERHGGAGGEAGGT